MPPTTDDSLISVSTKEMLLNLLKESGITVKTIDIQAGSIKGDNYLGIIAKADFTGKDSDGKEISDSYIIKSAPKSEGLRKFAPIRLAYEREIYVYSVILPEFEKFQQEKHIKNPFASYAHYLKYSIQNENEALIMKDMKVFGYKMQNRKEALDYNHIKLVIHELARLHAISFALRDQKPELFEEYSTKMKRNFFVEMEEEMFDAHSKTHCDKALSTLLPETDQAAIEKFKVFCESYTESIKTLLEEQCHPYSVIRHGDCWTNNFLFAYHDKSNPNKPTNLCFLDWQLTHVGPPVLDLLYFIYTCTDKQIRDKYFDKIFEYYYETLKDFTKELGTDLEKYFSYSILMNQLQKFGKFGLAIAVLILNFLLTDSEDIPDINKVFDDGESKMAIAEKFVLLHNDVYNKKMRDVILHVIEKGFI